MIFTNKNIKTGDIINRKNNIIFITNVKKDCVYYETIKGWKMGIINFNVEADLITDIKEINKLKAELNKNKIIETKKYEALQQSFDLRNNQIIVNKAFNKFIVLS